MASTKELARKASQQAAGGSPAKKTRKKKAAQRSGLAELKYCATQIAKAQAILDENGITAKSLARRKR